ncbi:hypothetical protein PIROE2DRAFT_7026, partial [Piromyces sp. E2]
DIFKIDEIKSNEKVLAGDALFMQFRYASYANENYVLSLMPGGKEGISSAIVSGFNYGINKYIKREHQYAAKQVLKYFSTKEVNKKVMLNSYVVSPIPSLFDDEDICRKFDCELIKNLQMDNKMFLEYNDYNYYSKKFRKYIFEYVYDDKPLEGAIKNIENLTKIYNLSLNTEDTYVVYWAITNKKFENDNIDIKKLLYLNNSKSSEDLNDSSRKSNSNYNKRHSLIELHNIQYILSSNESSKPIIKTNKSGSDSSNPSSKSNEGNYQIKNNNELYNIIEKE